MRHYCSKHQFFTPLGFRNTLAYTFVNNNKKNTVSKKKTLQLKLNICHRTYKTTCIMAKEWANDICGCFSDYKSCIITGCCPCITSYQIGSRLALKICATLSLVIYAVLLLFDFMVFIANRKTSELETEAWESFDHHDLE